MLFSLFLERIEKKGIHHCTHCPNSPCPNPQVSLMLKQQMILFGQCLLFIKSSKSRNTLEKLLHFPGTLCFEVILVNSFAATNTFMSWHWSALFLACFGYHPQLSTSWCRDDTTITGGFPFLSRWLTVVILSVKTNMLSFCWRPFLQSIFSERCLLEHSTCLVYICLFYVMPLQHI